MKYFSIFLLFFATAISLEDNKTLYIDEGSTYNFDISDLIGPQAQNIYFNNTS